MGRYSIISGSFICHTCNKTTKTARYYESTKNITWMCEEKHLSEVSLDIKKKKVSSE